MQVTMDIIQLEKDGIVCVSVKDRMETELIREFDEVVKQIVESGKRRKMLYCSIFIRTASLESRPDWCQQYYA